MDGAGSGTATAEQAAQRERPGDDHVAAALARLEQSLSELEAGPDFEEPAAAAAAAAGAESAAGALAGRQHAASAAATVPSRPMEFATSIAGVGAPATVELPSARSAPGLGDSTAMPRSGAHMTRGHDPLRWKPRLPQEDSAMFGEDQEFDTAETGLAVELTENAKSTVAVSSLAYLVKHLHNEEEERMRLRHSTVLGTWLSHVKEGAYNIFAAFWVHFRTTFHTESCFIVLNACFVTAVYCTAWIDTAVRLDLGLMTTAVIFPLSFLLQQSFQRREAALMQLSLFRSSVSTLAMVTFTADWPTKGGPSCDGRMQMPSGFNRMVYHNFKSLIYLIYAYLSMPTVGYARHRVISSQRRDTRRVHAAQNDILKRVAAKLGDISMHTELMKQHGYPATEASRVVNFVAIMSDRFELLKVVKYYRTPQATRAFGRVYVILLPWFMGPYTAFVANATGLAFSIALSGFSMIVFLGLMNSQINLEDPFTESDGGYDHIKLRYELASCLQALELHFRRAEGVRLQWDSANLPPAAACDADESAKVESAKVESAKVSSPRSGKAKDAYIAHSTTR